MNANKNESERITSTVAHWVRSLHFGFIQNPNRPWTDIYADANQFASRDGIGAHLIEGETVEFEIVEGRQGPIAKNITFPIRVDSRSFAVESPS